VTLNLLSVVTCLSMAAGVLAQQASPLRLVAEDPRGVATLALDAEAYAQLKTLQSVEIDGFVLGAGQRADVTLIRFDVFPADAQVRSVDELGEHAAERPDVQLWRGHVQGEPNSNIFLSLSPHGSSGMIESGGSRYIISSGAGGEQPTVVYDLASPAGQGVNITMPACDGAVLAPGEAAPPAEGVGSPYESRAYTCKRYRVAIDCDQEFTSSLFSGNATTSQAYATTLLAAVSEIYRRELNVELELAYLRTWTTTDPYTSPNNSEQLPEFAGYWALNMASVNRSLAHLFSGRGLGGGIAYLRQTCGSNGYGVSANLNGFFPYPIVNNSWQNWDLMVVAHELGHNMGTGHTHDPNSYNPPIDGCGSGDCSQRLSGTIMSYCHTCSGGMSNMSMVFGPRVVTAMRNYLDSLGATCGTVFNTTLISQQPTQSTVNEGQTITLTVNTSGPAATGYQWKKSNTPIENGGRISGATTNTLTITGALPSDASTYKVTIDTPCGFITSVPAAISVLACPFFDTQPEDAEAAESGSVTLYASAGGAFPRTYQWRRNGEPVANGPRVLGATSNTLTINPVEPADAATYDVVVSNTCGERTSDPAVLTVTGAPPCGTADFNGDGDVGTDADIESFFACLAGNCCPACFAGGSDFNADGDAGTDADIESFFRVLGGGAC